jgi:hypothetical protein
MDASIEALWSDYLAAERDRIRDVMMPALNLFPCDFHFFVGFSFRYWSSES